MNIGGKYFPLMQTAVISLAFFLSAILVILPVTLFLKGVPLSSWLLPLAKLASVGGILSSVAIFMAWMFCELYSANLKRFMSAVIYAIVCPVVFILILGVVLLLWQGTFLNGISEQKGKENLLIIFSAFSLICFGIYWSGSKNCLTKLS